jgi:hypothetical protein
VFYLKGLGFLKCVYIYICVCINLHLLTPQEIISRLHETVKVGDFGAKRLVTEALITSKDNITCVVVYLKVCVCLVWVCLL